jgi:hypothetical protein
MSEPKRRSLVGTKIAEHPLILKSFATIGALLIATKATDLQADIDIGGRIFHFDVKEVKKP